MGKRKENPRRKSIWWFAVRIWGGQFGWRNGSFSVSRALLDPCQILLDCHSKKHGVLPKWPRQLDPLTTKLIRWFSSVILDSGHYKPSNIVSYHN